MGEYVCQHLNLEYIGKAYKFEFQGQNRIRKNRLSVIVGATGNVILLRGDV